MYGDVPRLSCVGAATPGRGIGGTPYSAALESTLTGTSTVGCPSLLTPGGRLGGAYGYGHGGSCHPGTYHSVGGVGASPYRSPRASGSCWGANQGGLDTYTSLRAGGGSGYDGYGATPSGYAALAGSRMRSRGVLTVHLKRAVALKKADVTGKSDPYVIISVPGGGAPERKSRVVSRSLDPVWNETFEFAEQTLEELLQRGLRLAVFDKDTFTKDDPLGEIVVSLDPLRARSSHEYQEALPTQGSLIFSVSWDPVGAVAPHAMESGTLHVVLVRGAGLKSMDRNGFSDPYVRLTCNGITHKSKVVKKTLDPSWEEEFTFRGVLRELCAAPLQLHAFDHDLVGRDDRLGVATAELRGLEAGDIRECARCPVPKRVPKRAHAHRIPCPHAACHTCTPPAVPAHQLL